MSQNSRINRTRKHPTPQVEWADPNVPEYESDSVSSGDALARSHTLAGAFASTTGQAGLELGNRFKRALTRKQK